MYLMVKKTKKPGFRHHRQMCQLRQFCHLRQRDILNDIEL